MLENGTMLSPGVKRFRGRYHGDMIGLAERSGRLD